MKKILTLAAIGSFIMMGVAQSNAQTTNTNVITITITNTVTAQNLNIALTGFTGSTNGTTASSVKIGNKQVLEALGAPTNSKLLVLLPTGGDTNTPVTPIFVVRNGGGGTNVDVDVSGFFSVTTEGVPVAKSKINGQGRVTGTEWSINTFTFGGAGEDTNAVPTSVFFRVQGFTTTSLSKGNFNSQVNGPGIVNGSDAVMKGNIKASGGKTETSIITIEVPVEDACALMHEQQTGMIFSNKFLSGR